MKIIVSYQILIFSFWNYRIVSNLIIKAWNYRYCIKIKIYLSAITGIMWMMWISILQLHVSRVCGSQYNLHIQHLLCNLHMESICSVLMNGMKFVFTALFDRSFHFIIVHFNAINDVIIVNRSLFYCIQNVFRFTGCITVSSMYVLCLNLDCMDNACTFWNNRTV